MPFLKYFLFIAVSVQAIWCAEENNRDLGPNRGSFSLPSTPAGDVMRLPEKPEALMELSPSEKMQVVCAALVKEIGFFDQKYGTNEENGTNEEKRFILLITAQPFIEYVQANRKEFSKFKEKNEALANKIESFPKISYYNTLYPQNLSYEWLLETRKSVKEEEKKLRKSAHPT